MFLGAALFFVVTQSNMLIVSISFIFREEALVVGSLGNEVILHTMYLLYGSE